MPDAQRLERLKYESGVRSTVTEYRKRLLLDQLVDLPPGREWHSEPLSLLEGDVVTVSASSTQRFYAAFADREEYHRKIGAVAGAFSFEFGTDRRGYTVRQEISLPENYYLVLRVGVFGDTASIRARVEVLRPARAPSAP